MHLYLLGGFALTCDQHDVHLESVKSVALIAYLAMRHGAVTRARLSGLLWPDLDDERAARNLRHAVWDQRRRLAARGRPPLLRATRTTLELARHEELCIDCDLVLAACARLDHPTTGAGRLSREELAEVDASLAHYRGDLLDGFYLDDAPELEDEITAERERLKLMAIEGLLGLARELATHGEVAAALERARRALALDSWREATHRLVMELLARDGQTAAALMQFERCRMVLAEELQATPTAQTVELYRRIRDERLLAARGGDEVGPHGSPARVRHVLPLPATPFVGRGTELERIAALLAEPSCRLLSLVGPGGIGKTRLALQAARAVAGGGAEQLAWADGVTFVDLSELTSPDLLVPTIAAAVGLQLVGTPDTEHQLLTYLADRQTLLVLDSFERAAGGAALLGALLASSPGSKMLLTSRVRSRLREEWLLEIHGLALPEGGSEAAVLASDAGKLFLDCARRADLSFSPAAGDWLPIERICRLLDGMPLGIELAAAWLRVLPAREVAREIEASLAFLSGSLAALPPRQRSLEVVFEQTWSQLTSDEEHALATLSVCRGGFSRPAAEAVGNATLTVLAGLIEKSLLRRDPAGRYLMHEVMRQLAGERLAGEASDWHTARERHAAFFATLAASTTTALGDGGRRAAVAELGGDLDNIRAAWEWAVEQCHAERLASMLPGFAAIHSARGWFREGADALTQAANILQPSEGIEGATRARLLSAAGEMLNHIGHYAEAAALLAEALELLAVGGAERDRAETLCRLGEGTCRQGRYDDAHSVLNDGLALAREIPGSGTCVRALVGLGQIALERSAYDEARRRFGEALELAYARGDTEKVADTLARLGRVALESGDLNEAGARLEESLRLAREAGDVTTETQATAQLGHVAYFAQRYESAAELLSTSLELSRSSGNRAASAFALLGLGYVAEDLGDFVDAEASYLESVAIARELGDRLALAKGVTALGELLRGRERAGDAARWYEEGLALAREIGAQFLVAANLGNLGFLAANAGDLDGARALLIEALELSLALGAVPLQLNTIVGFSVLASREGRHGAGLELLGMAMHHPASRSDTKAEVERILPALRAALPAATVEAALERGHALSLGDAISTVVNTDRP